ncbi:sigma-54 dependent transcriptional regulator [Reinekea sp.]|uniref:sigma-54-dependent transcriptional regulator n=1 Tax=Reinekea sp. TaxID=1970455 RepID=UPI00257F2D4C|nr:sigma-54 dependent transcriptional regulator [Reinekea sp.]
MKNNPNMYHVMVVDDDPAIRESLEQWLSLADIEVKTYASAHAALIDIPKDYPGVIVSDVRMPAMDGMEFLKRASKNIPFILITGHGGITLAVEAMKAGAYDFVEKPYNPERLVDMIKTACKQRQHYLANKKTEVSAYDLNGIESKIIGQSAAVIRLRKRILALAKVNSDVVISGETGSGKELVAQCLHEYSVRREHAFVPINVSAIPENLIESELFGYEVGAFTGATKSHSGKFEYAHGGTLLLDEIESMPMYFQVKILRVLQEREVVRIGSHTPKRIDVRIVAATKKDLKLAVQEGDFREDLYYRLLVSEIKIPPLRDRKEDIVMLFKHFLTKAANFNGLVCPEISVEEGLVLETYSWPGNIRELKNTAERYMLIHHIDDVSVQELLQVSQPEPSGSNTLMSEASLSARLEHVEKMLIDAELKLHEGNIKTVMDVLDLPRRTLNQKMQKYGLRREEYLPN